MFDSLFGKDFFKTRKAAFDIAVLSVVCALLFCSFLGRSPFFDKGEPREGLVVQAIVHRGEWLFPLKNEGEIPSKPPLFHWFAAVASLVRGRVTERTMRFPSALFGILGVLVVYVLGLGIYDPDTALLAGMILATSLGYQTQAVAARVDMTLTVFITLTLAIFYPLFRGSLTRPFWNYGFYFLAGIGVLAKGPISLIITGMVICFYLALRKRWDFLYRLAFHRGALLTLVIALSWYGMALIRGGEEFFALQVIHENIGRFLSYGEAGSGHEGPPYIYLLHLLVLGLPWTLFLPFVVSQWFKSKSFAEAGSSFLIVWVVAIFIFFSLSAGKRGIYILPLYPPLALLSARWFGTEARTGELGALGLRILAGICLIASVALGAVLLLGISGKGLDFIAAMLSAKDRAGFMIVEEVLRRGGWIFVSVMTALVVLWLLVSWHLSRLRPSAVPAKLFLISLLTWMWVQGSVVPAIAEGRSYRSFMRKVDRRVPPESRLYIYPAGFDATPVFFYRGASQAMEEDPEELVKRLRSPRDFVIMSEREWREIQRSHGWLPAPILKSASTGPDGDAPLVLLHSGSGGDNP